MNWKQLIADLAAAGVTQSQIAEECGVAQATVSDLYRGETKSPGFEFGNKLVQLHRAKVAADTASDLVEQGV